MRNIQLDLVYVCILIFFGSVAPFYSFNDPMNAYADAQDDYDDAYKLWKNKEGILSNANIHLDSAEGKMGDLFGEWKENWEDLSRDNFLSAFTTDPVTLFGVTQQIAGDIRDALHIANKLGAAIGDVKDKHDAVIAADSELTTAYAAYTAAAKEAKKTVLDRENYPLFPDGINYPVANVICPNCLRMLSGKDIGNLSSHVSVCNEKGQSRWFSLFYLHGSDDLPIPGRTSHV